MPTRRRRRPVPLAIPALAVAAGLIAHAPAPARAQVGLPGVEPQPTISDINQRSGLLHRFMPIESHLPSDPRRDHWYTTRWADPPDERAHPNFYMNNGLYGLRWKAVCTRSIYPYFFGAAGQDTLTEDCRPCRPFWRIGSAFIHPFKPVGIYYDQGSYAPVYDLDPLVPGPGSWPFPFFRRITSAGG
jgi:hypothetical protein